MLQSDIIFKFFFKFKLSKSATTAVAEPNPLYSFDTWLIHPKD